MADFLTIIPAIIASFFMAWAVGAGSSGSTPFAPAVGANALPIMRAGFLVGILTLAGAIIQGENISKTLGQSMIVGVQITPTAATAALLTAATLIAIGVYTGYPIATAFTVTGAIIGVGIGIGGGPAWSKYFQIASLWILAPILGTPIAYITARILRETKFEGLIASFLGGIVGVILLNIQLIENSIVNIAADIMPFLAIVDKILISIIGFISIFLIFLKRVSIDPKRTYKRFVLILGGLVAFSAGGSQVGLAVGPLSPLLPQDIFIILIFGGIGMLIGSWTGAPRMIKALSRDYSSLGPRRSIAALVPAFIIAQTAIFAGLPVSFNEITISTVIGSGYSSGEVSPSKIGYTALAWIGSLIMSFIISYSLISYL